MKDIPLKIAAFFIVFLVCVGTVLGMIWLLKSEAVSLTIKIIALIFVCLSFDFILMPWDEVLKEEKKE